MVVNIRCNLMVVNITTNLSLLYIIYLVFFRHEKVLKKKQSSFINFIHAYFKDGCSAGYSISYR